MIKVSYTVKEGDPRQERRLVTDRVRVFHDLDAAVKFVRRLAGVEVDGARIVGKATIEGY